jgi:hypothetical protein
VVYLVITTAVLKYTLVTHHNLDNSAKIFALFAILFVRVLIVREVRHVFLASQSLFKFILFHATPRIEEFSVLLAKRGWRIFNDSNEGIEVIGHVEVYRSKQVVLGLAILKVKHEEVVRMSVAVRLEQIVVNKVPPRYEVFVQYPLDIARLIPNSLK